jgi:hypothetical protein
MPYEEENQQTNETLATINSDPKYFDLKNSHFSIYYKFVNSADVIGIFVAIQPARMKNGLRMAESDLNLCQMNLIHIHLSL